MAEHSARAPVQITGVAVFSSAPYVRDFLEGARTDRVAPSSWRSRAYAHASRFPQRSGPLLAAYPKSRFIEARLSKETVALARSSNAVCLFVNDDWCVGASPHLGGPHAQFAHARPPRSDEEVCAALAAQGVKLIAMRCAGFDRVDLAAAAKHGLTVVRVPSYSPHAVRAHAHEHDAHVSIRTTRLLTRC